MEGKVALQKLVQVDERLYDNKNTVS